MTFQDNNGLSTDIAAATEARGEFRGVIHFHSEYSHDGRDQIPVLAQKLALQRFDFCILTDHFEDFDASDLDRYRSEIEAVNAVGSFIMVPAIEVEYESIHVILVPVGRFDEIKKSVIDDDFRQLDAVRLLAHPTKYDLETTVSALRKHEFDGIELWNQAADGKYAPPYDKLRILLPQIRPDSTGHFFGCDIHDGRHSVANYLTIPADGPLTLDYIVAALRARRYTSKSRLTGHILSAALPASELPRWLETTAGSRNLRVAFTSGLTRVLKYVYHSLPRPLRKRINHFKNTVKSRL